MDTVLAPADAWDDGKPAINGPEIYGASPGKEILYLIPAVGRRPMRFDAEGLPPGLRLDEESGRILGRTEGPGQHVVRLRASNEFGQAEKALRLVIAEDSLALTPPMGWNSWNCFRGEIDADKILRIARGLVSSGLAARGYSYVNLDSGWQSGRRGGPFHAILPHEGFPNMAGLCEQIHALGLKMGIYSGPYVVPWGTDGCGTTSGLMDTNYASRLPRAGKYIGLEKHESQDAAQWAAWGVDYVKYDWVPTDMQLAARMSRALKQCPRDMVFSITTSVDIRDAREASDLCNLWRSNDDTHPTWQSIQKNGFGNEVWNPVIRPGHWFDLDMTAFLPRDGKRLTHNEQIACMTCWAIRPSPLLIDCIPDELDDFTRSLLCNEEVLAVNQDPWGKPAATVTADPDRPVQLKPLAGGGYAAAFFNLTDSAAQSEELDLAAIGLTGGATVRDLWAKRDLPGRRATLAVPVAPYCAKMFRLVP